jgi:hypothetical protein
MADIINPDESVMTHNADVYWHYAGDPVQRSQLLGTFTIGAPQKVLLPIPADADIVLRAVPRGGRGQTFMAGPGDATPVTVSALGVGTGGGTSNFYQQLRVNHGYSYGTTPTPRPALNLLQSFQIKDDSVYGESDLTTYGVPTGQLNLKTDFNASGQIAVTTASGVASTGIVTLATTLELQPGQGIYLADGGVAHAPLITTVLTVSADGKTLTLNSGPFTDFTGKTAQADDTAAVQGWLNAKGDLAMPPGYFRLTSSIMVPTTSEGFSIIIHGSGWDQSQFVFQNHGDGFIPTSDLKIDSLVFIDLTVATGTIGDSSGTIDASSRGIGIRMTAPGYTGIYNNFVMQRCRIIGWGRWGLWSDNLEVSWISQCIFRENKSGHIAFVGPDTISPNKQPNANTITDTTFDQAISAGPADAKRTTSGSMTAGSRTLTGSGFSAADRGKFVIVHGAATSGGDLFSFIDTFNTSSQVTLAHQAQFTSSGTVEVFPINVASILLNRANDTVLDGSTIQGNFADAGSGATNTASDVNAIKAYNSANCRFIGIHEEDNAGPGGAAIRMENCIAMTIENWGGTSAGPPNFDNAHGSDFQLINSHCISVKNSFFNDRPQFVIDSTSSEVQIDDSLVTGYINLWQQDNSWDRVRIGSGVRVYQSADPRTNQVAGNEYLYDSMFGLSLLQNGRFLDGTGGNEGWTTAQPTWWSNPFTALTRFGSYIRIDATAIAASTTPTTIFHQAAAVPDSLPPGLFTLAFDWYLEAQNGVETTGYYVEVRAHPSTGIDEVCQFSTRRFSLVTGIWQSNQIRCFLGSGTSRTIDVQMNVTPGPNNVKIRLTNFRLTPGKHSFGAYERAVHDFGGRMRAPLEFVPTSAVTYPPPASGSTTVSLANIAGVLNIGSNGAYAPVGAGGGGGGANIQLSNLAAVTAINSSFQFDTDGAYNIGTPTTRIGALYAKNGFWVYAVGSNTAGPSPKSFGVLPTGLAGSSAECGLMMAYGARNSIQSGDLTRTQFASYYGIELRGTRGQNGAPNFVAGSASDASVRILSETNVVPLQVNSSTALSVNLAEFYNNNALKARIDQNGNSFFVAVNATGNVTATGTGSAAITTAGHLALTQGTSTLDLYPSITGSSRIIQVSLQGAAVEMVPYGHGTNQGDSFLWDVATGVWKAGIPYYSGVYAQTGAFMNQRPYLKFVGSGVAVTDDSVNGWTLVTITAGSGGGGITGTGTANRLTKWSAPGVTITDAGIDDNGTQIVMQRDFLYSRVDGSCNLGDTTNRMGGVYIKNTLQLFSGGSTAGPISSGFRDSAAGEANRFWINGVGNAWQCGNGTRSAIYGFHSIELRGNRRNASTGPAYTTIAGSDSSGVLVYQETDVPPLVINSSLTLTSSLFVAQNNSSTKFAITPAGSVWSEGGIRNAVALIQPAAGANVDATNYLNYHILILDTLNGSWTLTLPLLTTTIAGVRWRLICNRRTSTATVTVKCQSGNDINETGSGVTSGWILRPNTNNARDAIVTGDYYNTQQWWLANLMV